jgi:hypothetical protein
MEDKQNGVSQTLLRKPSVSDLTSSQKLFATKVHISANVLGSGRDM